MVFHKKNQPFKFAVLTNSSENNPVIGDMIDAGLLPSLICSDSPFHFISSNHIIHFIKLIWSVLHFVMHRERYTKKYQPYFLAKKWNIPFVPSYKVNNETFTQSLKKYDIDIGFVFTFQILDKRTLKLAPCEFINFHPSLLPEHRGATPYQYSILEGDGHTGITFHKIDEGIDTGPVLEQYKIPLSGVENAKILYNHLLQLGSLLLINLIYRIQYSGKIPDPVKVGTAKSLEPAFQTGYHKLEINMTWSQMDRLVKTCCFPGAEATFILQNIVYPVMHCVRLENFDTGIMNLPYIDGYNNIILQTADGVLVCLVTKPKIVGY